MQLCGLIYGLSRRIQEEIKLVVKRSDKCCKVKDGEMVKYPEVIGWKANARPPGWKVWENAPL